jgi:hypothetical protein
MLKVDMDRHHSHFWLKIDSCHFLNYFCKRIVIFFEMNVRLSILNGTTHGNSYYQQKPLDKQRDVDA